MAYIVKIVEGTEKSTNAGIEVKWWDKEELQKKYSFEKYPNDGYLDYILPVDKKSFCAILNEQEKYRDVGILDCEAWKKINNETKMYLDMFVKRMEDSDIANICIVEV